ncbi:putative armadillo-like helical, pumilio domain-containing protein [Helianthus annuus]|uniref:Armadillo-like helical, pumilio domain-containing protein n=1 Tax=Helianthus annuus TaxID=4232 RepID=A0A9K3N9T0_HELAN|nr:putative armadillo-like helical, pumilio domain-containing protein [Helianthus annuus]KAJ0712595.1 putative armadillo-like helical, pumilio domain-containing protein [Helianthus annuus]KAJ0894520.1 putative armadillo-like helical, pumilio domain-containing protein [Helianthus annuus]
MVCVWWVTVQVDFKSCFRPKPFGLLPNPLILPSQYFFLINYVLQHMVGLQSPELTEVLVSQLQGNFAYLSQNKYASNVVEKCLIESEPDIATKIILELVKSPNAPSLLVDPYGNFVIQSALKVSRGIAKECLRELILRNVNSMQSNLYGKKILEKVEKKRTIYK